MFEADGFNAEVVHDETEGDGSPHVSPESGGVLALVVASFCESFGKEFIGKYSGLR